MNTMRPSTKPDLAFKIARVFSPWAVASIGGLCIGVALLRIDKVQAPDGSEGISPRAAMFGGPAEDASAEDRYIETGADLMLLDPGEMTLSPRLHSAPEIDASAEPVMTTAEEPVLRASDGR